MVCPLGIIDSADEAHLPQVQEANAPRCVDCGHCEVSCPAEALKLNLASDEACDQIIEPGKIAPESLGIYLRSRRSVRRFIHQNVEKEKIEQVLDIARYAASGGNMQPVQWLVIYDEKEVQRLAGLTIDWMRHLSESKNNPLSAYADQLIAAWEQGIDPICRSAPHLLIAHIPEDRPIAPVDAIIALTHFDIAAPAFGLGTCWAGFLSLGAASWEPLQRALALPPGRIFAYAMMFGYPQYRTYRIPRRNPVHVTWRQETDNGGITWKK